MEKRVNSIDKVISCNQCFVAGCVIRHPRTNFPLLHLTYATFPNVITLVSDGVDQPGVAAYLTTNLQRFGLNYDACTCERGVHGQGARFELPNTPDSFRGLQLMYEHIQRHPEEFKPRMPVEFDRLINVAIRMPKDGCGLLTRPTAYLAERDINMRYLRAEKSELDKVLGLHEVKVIAQLEVPGIETSILETELLHTCPGRSEVKLQELWRR
jgi:hypothetical protein